MQRKIYNYIMNRSSIIQLNNNLNTIYCQDELLKLVEGDDSKMPLFCLKCSDEKISIIPVSSVAIYMNEILVENEALIKNRTIISTNEHTEFLIFTVYINPEVAIIDKQDILVHFLDSDEMNAGSGFDILEFLKNGAEKLQIDEFFSIIAQCDVPEIDQ